jgi:hypothetical protein
MVIPHFTILAYSPCYDLGKEEGAMVATARGRARVAREGEMRDDPNNIIH